tara:strand:+ start:1563 stop:2798 length:1236 start_codon:yes stop_codon:yes gene_type:complete
LTLISCNNSNKEKLEIPGWNLVWHDEFNNKNINLRDWEFDIGTGAPVYDSYGFSSPIFSPESFPKDDFSVRWNGKISIKEGGEYTFYTVSDDGVRLYVNNQLIIDQWNPQPPKEFSGTIFLDSNKKYLIKVEYFEEGGGEAMILGWESEYFSKQLITSVNLETTTGEPGLTGTYFPNKFLKRTNKGQIITRVDKELNWITGGGWGNNELQYYTNNPDNVRINNGKLLIEARKEFFRGSQYTSARIKTTNSWKYGRFEVKAKLPKGRGTWAAAWGLPSEWVYGPWPYSGEIDILEHVGFDEGVVVSSIHNIAYAGDVSRSDQQGINTIPLACQKFHTYVLEWEEEIIRIITNGKTVLEYKKNDQGWERWPYDQTFHLLFNIAIGGWWGGAKGVDNSIFPSIMEIDYVRVYQR